MTMVITLVNSCSKNEQDKWITWSKLNRHNYL